MNCGIQCNLESSSGGWQKVGVWLLASGHPSTLVPPFLFTLGTQAEKLEVIYSWGWNPCPANLETVEPSCQNDLFRGHRKIISLHWIKIHSYVNSCHFWKTLHSSHSELCSPHLIVLNTHIQCSLYFEFPSLSRGLRNIQCGWHPSKKKMFRAGWLSGGCSLKKPANHTMGNQLLKMPAERVKYPGSCTIF